MSKEAFFMELHNAKLVNAPVDLNTAAVTGERVSMKNAKRITFLILLASSTGAVLTFNLKQHNAGSGGTTKTLSTTNPYYHKLGTATKFTKVEPGAASDAIDLTTLAAADGGIVAVEVLAEDLDVNNNFTHVSINSTDTNAAKIGAVVAITGNDSFISSYGTDL
jgi:hypothetical protein